MTFQPLGLWPGYQCWILLADNNHCLHNNQHISYQISTFVLGRETVFCLWASLLQLAKKGNFMGGCQHSNFYSCTIPWMTTRHQMFGSAISQIDLHQHNISWLARWFILTILLKTMCCQHIHFAMWTQHWTCWQVHTFTARAKEAVPVLYHSLCLFWKNMDGSVSVLFAFACAKFLGRAEHARSLWMQQCITRNKSFADHMKDAEYCHIHCIQLRNDYYWQAGMKR